MIVSRPSNIAQFHETHAPHRQASLTALPLSHKTLADHETRFLRAPCTLHSPLSWTSGRVPLAKIYEPAQMPSQLDWRRFEKIWRKVEALQQVWFRRPIVRLGFQLKWKWTRGNTLSAPWHLRTVLSLTIYSNKGALNTAYLRIKFIRRYQDTPCSSFSNVSRSSCPCAASAGDCTFSKL